jgi:hypothetical protein
MRAWGLDESCRCNSIVPESGNYDGFRAANAREPSVAVRLRKMRAKRTLKAGRLGAREAGRRARLGLLTRATTSTTLGIQIEDTFTPKPS